MNWFVFWLSMFMRLAGACYMLASIWGDDSMFVRGALTYLMAASISMEEKSG